MSVGVGVGVGVVVAAAAAAAVVAAAVVIAKATRRDTGRTSFDNRLPWFRALPHTVGACLPGNQLSHAEQQEPFEARN